MPYTSTSIDEYEGTCWDSRGPPNGVKSPWNNYDTYAVDSRCVNVQYSSNGFQGVCMTHTCQSYSVAEQRWSAVEITIGSETITCDRNDKFTNKNVNGATYDITCPDVDIICGSSSQPFSCYYGHWDDDINGCVCSAGYTGSDCNTRDDSNPTETEVSIANPQTSTNPTVICVKNFPFSQFNGEYDYVDDFNYQPSYKNGNNFYVYWHFWNHQWQIYTSSRDSGSGGYFSCLVNDDEYVDISEIRKCDGM